MPTAMSRAVSNPIVPKGYQEDHSEVSGFHPEQHLAFQPPESIVSMKDIGYGDGVGISPVAVSQPFRLFSPKAVQSFRNEILSPKVFEKYSYHSNIAASHLRGFVAECAPFTYDAWNHPETLDIVSKIAGVDLIPAMNIEIAHVNISVKSVQDARNELESAKADAETSSDRPSKARRLDDNEKPVVGWHTDSYPFVCVTMLSDCTNMIGGETALRTANNEVLKVRGPDKGCAVVMQGRYITHQALHALGAQERITMVTSFRPKSPHLWDDAVLTTVRGISDLSQLYYEFGRYRLEILEERIRAELRKLSSDRAAGKKTDTRALKAFLKQQVDFLSHTDGEIVQDEDVVAGHQPVIDIPNAS